MDLLIFSGLLFASSQPVDEASLSEIIKLRADEFIEAFLQEDFAKWVDLIYPKIVEEAGGRQKMIEILRQRAEGAKERGTRKLFVNIGMPKIVASEGEKIYSLSSCAVSFEIKGKKAIRNGYILAISDDRGKTWTFFEYDKPKSVRALIPDFPKSITLPEVEPPKYLEDQRSDKKAEDKESFSWLAWGVLLLVLLLLGVMIYRRSWALSKRTRG